MQAALKQAVTFSNLAPGVTAAVVSDHGSWQGAYGVSGVRQPLVPDAVMAIASISKTFTAAEVLPTSP
jgi:CubicO group peptidase (beta-lactamase class C family)